MKRVLSEESGFVVGAQVPVSDAESHHLLRVLRAKQGEAVEVLGKGSACLARLEMSGKCAALTCESLIDAASRESPLDLHVVLACPVHRQTLDGLVPALVQLGVNQVTVVQSAFGGSLKTDLEKWLSRLSSIEQQARKQSGRIHEMSIYFERNMALALDQADGLKIVLDPSGGPTDMAEILNELTLVIGPEGGFSREELNVAVSAGFLVCSLGPRILRMETAAVGACFWAQSRFGDFRLP